MRRGYRPGTRAAEELTSPASALIPPEAPSKGSPCRLFYLAFSAEEVCSCKVSNVLGGWDEDHLDFGWSWTGLVVLGVA